MTNLNLEPIKVGLIAYNISGSITPEIHNIYAKNIGLRYHYTRIDTAKEAYCSYSLEKILENLKTRENFTGVNISYPFKVEIIKLLTSHSYEVKLTNSCNTVVFRNNEIIGHNTDYTGYKYLLETSLKAKNKENILILGSGGAGSSIAIAFLETGTKVLNLFDKSIESAYNLRNKLSKRAKELKQDIKINVLNNVDKESTAYVDGIINTTPMGMSKSPSSAIDTNIILPKTWVHDIVYFPLETEFMKQSKKIGCEVFSGVNLAIAQAYKSFEIFSSKNASYEEFEKIALSEITRRENL